MDKTNIALSLVVSLTAACGASTPSTEPPHATAPAGTGGIAQPGDPTGTFPSQGGTAISGAPASPMEGGCKGGTINAQAKDLDACLDGCKGQDDTVPPGSRCISAKASCTSQCRTKFGK